MGAKRGTTYPYGFSFDDAGRFTDDGFDARGVDPPKAAVSGRLLAEAPSSPSWPTPPACPSHTYAYYSATATPVENRGKPMSVTDVVGTTSYAYNTSGSAPGKLASITDPLSGQATDYSYYSDGRLQGRSDPAGLNWHLDYDASTGRVGLETVTRGASDEVAYFDPSYDAAGNVTQMVQRLEDTGGSSSANPENGTWTYHYDEASRLDSATLAKTGGGTRNYAYCYDAAGNRLKNVACNASGVTTTYDAAGLAVSEGTKTFTHDGVGNLLKVESGGAVQSSYGFDAWGRLTSATAGSEQVSYVNDALGRTISRTQGTQTTALTYQGVGETLVREAGVQTIDYAQSPQGPLAQRVGSDVSFFIKNPHGDVVGTATSANLSSSLAYSPYGELRGQAAGRLGYQGQMRDEATGLVDMTTRHYDPTMGRFISQDVLFGDLNSPMSLNQYAYAAGNPVTMWDPTGMAAPQECAERGMLWCRNHYYEWRENFEDRQEERGKDPGDYNFALGCWRCEDKTQRHVYLKPSIMLTPKDREIARIALESFVNNIGDGCEQIFCLDPTHDTVEYWVGGPGGDVSPAEAMDPPWYDIVGHAYDMTLQFSANCKPRVSEYWAFQNRTAEYLDSNGRVVGQDYFDDLVTESGYYKRAWDACGPVVDLLLKKSVTKVN